MHSAINPIRLSIVSIYTPPFVRLIIMYNHLLRNRGHRLQPIIYRIRLVVFHYLYFFSATKWFCNKKAVKATRSQPFLLFVKESEIHLYRNLFPQLTQDLHLFHACSQKNIFRFKSHYIKIRFSIYFHLIIPPKNYSIDIDAANASAASSFGTSVTLTPI